MEPHKAQVIFSLDCDFLSRLEALGVVIIPLSSKFSLFDIYMACILLYFHEWGTYYLKKWDCNASSLQRWEIIIYATLGHLQCEPLNRPHTYDRRSEHSGMLRGRGFSGVRAAANPAFDCPGPPKLPGSLACISRLKQSAPLQSVSVVFMPNQSGCELSLTVAFKWHAGRESVACAASPCTRLLRFQTTP